VIATIVGFHTASSFTMRASRFLNESWQFLRAFFLD
jgi:hypothetical protein